jgi:hypothetical protein
MLRHYIEFQGAVWHHDDGHYYECQYVECRYAECSYTGCHCAVHCHTESFMVSITMQSVIAMSAVMMSVVMLRAIEQCVLDTNAGKQFY